MCTCVPTVSTTCPGKLSMEGGEEVKDGPGQDDNVVHTSVQDDHLVSIAYAFWEIFVIHTETNPHRNQFK